MAGLRGSDGAAARRRRPTHESPSSTARVHERAGSIRMYETLPFFSGPLDPGGRLQPGEPVTTHAVYYLASELGATSPNPFRSREYSQFDTDAASRTCASST